MPDIFVSYSRKDQSQALALVEHMRARGLDIWFDQHAMLALVEEVLTDTKRRGFPFTRWVANMGWALGEWRGVSDLVEYCTRLNEVVPKHEATIVCTYDLARFSASSVIDVLRSHPVAVIGGIVAWVVFRGGSQPGPAGRLQSGGPTPVGVTKVEKGDMPVLLSGLGTVTPLAMVTVKTQISSIYRKLGVSRRAEAIAKTSQLHLLSPDP